MQQVFIESIEELRAWLLENHDKQESVWLVRWKKSAGKPIVNYTDIVDQLLCFGWIDSLPRKLDEHRTMLRISPRNPKSNWSGINKKKIAKLIEQGLMHESGLALVEQAKKNGTWNFLDDVEQLISPPDLLQALDSYPKAAYFFNRFPASSKRGILEWVKSAKTDATRSRRIVETAKKASQNLKANHPKGRDAGPVDTKGD